MAQLAVNRQKLNLYCTESINVDIFSFKVTALMCVFVFGVGKPLNGTAVGLI